MIIVVLILLGLCFGSFVNALVWRIYKQDSKSKAKKQSKSKEDYSILHGRSMCTHCGHTLSALDLIPVLSWLSLSGKCRYCHRPISWQYPLVELLTACLFVASYLFWPEPLQGYQIVSLCFWLIYVIGFMALAVYDLRWFLLPNRIIFPLMYLAGAQFLVHMIFFDGGTALIINTVGGILVGGGIFYLLFQLSKGKWIGGGDVKLGFLLGAILASASSSLLLIFIASLIGTVVSIPILATKRLTKQAHVPFGPFLLSAAVIVQLFGADMIAWYKGVIGL